MLTAILKNKWALVAIVIFCWALVASSALGYYFSQYTDLVSRIGGLPVSVNLCVDYDNGTRQWFNGTIGATLYDTMIQAGWDVETTSFDIAGLYVSAINNVRESTDDSRYWGWWSWTEYGWYHGGSACDKYIVGPDESVIWYYSYYYYDNTTRVWKMATPP